MGILDGKVAIVTGSGQGVGFEIAKALAKEGAKIITNNRKPGSNLLSMEGSTLEITEDERQKLQSCTGDAKTAADYINNNGGTAVPFFGDVKDNDVAKACVKSAIDNFGRIDILINNAASTWNGSIEIMTEKEWHILIDSKLNGSFNMVQHALPYMLEQKYGRIINASSDGWLGLTGLSAYGAACAGIWSFTRAIAQDLAGTGVTANAYTPNAKTRSWVSTVAKCRSQGIPEEALVKAAPESMKYTADVFAAFFAYLASDLATNINGYMFKTAADGQLGVWSEPEVIDDIWTDEIGKPWTMEELIAKVPNMISDEEPRMSTIDLK
ncbi:SDR family NAD(P)-dependent oxidoreductase [Acetobacterium paludosum]|uniref:SDR family NAD(P)-dependent oxidoreductase n=1 Tax=Acetobacterium paludosum TaxID=52693 RepID=A0A923HY30_9FIRM|nr:SDR family NAD(P)-dependent oxidoreductase [Acetobacterium paludosum]MBC3888116.1 SDR family NAD(P)-dependent oxidoreductase [Acetobacterium paludosum]